VRVSRGTEPRGRSRRSRSRGQALAEFAIIAPLFFLMIFFVVQIGLIFAAQNGLVDGVRNAARRAATYRINDQSFDTTVWSSICSTIATELDRQLSDSRTGIIGFTSANRTRSIAYEWEQNPGGGDYFLVAHVSATYKNQLYVPLVSAFLDITDGVLDNMVQLSASEKMRVENPGLAPTPLPSVPACP
jgi:Flp pilus assembly protein TadG